MTTDPPPAADPVTLARLRKWQAVTVGTLFTGYLGYYVCRSNLSVVTPLLLAEYGDAGLTQAAVGTVVSAGMVAYAVGKFVNGVGADLLGGRRLFLLGMAGSVLMTLLFALLPARAAGLGAGGVGVAVLLPMAVAWAGNRFAQSMGWGGVVQIAARWTEPGRLGTVMGVLAMSYLLGDVFARLALGELIRHGYGWRGVFHFSALALGAVGVATLVLLRGRPADVGLPEPPPPPENVYGDGVAGRLSLRELVGPLLGNRAFWLVCGMSAGLTFLRETFNFWTPTYLTKQAGLDAGTAGVTSLVFPLTGGLSALAAGWAVDRVRGRHGLVMATMLAALVATLLVLAFAPIREVPPAARAPLVLGLVSVAAFCLVGPYTFCAGVLAVNLGGPRGGSTTAGFIDTAGYVAAVPAGLGVGAAADLYGWPAAFGGLAAVAALTLAVAAAYGVTQGRR